MKTDFEIRSLISDDPLINQKPSFIHLQKMDEEGRFSTTNSREKPWRRGVFRKMKTKRGKKKTKNELRFYFASSSSSSFFFFMDNKRSDRVENNFFFPEIIQDRFTTEFFVNCLRYFHFPQQHRALTDPRSRPFFPLLRVSCNHLD